MATSVRMIPASLQMHSSKSVQHVGKRKTAAYARVSTDSEEQQTSYVAQVDYYTKYIQERADWEFAGIYTDEGISAVSTKKRDGFNRMVADALAGKIELIVTKSVSRFARNTVDSLTTVRKLKEKGVEVFFEKENIYTFDGKGELLISIMSSLAQEESRSISENVTWGQRKRFADGKVTMPYGMFLGYEKGEDGRPKVIESEAKTVRSIYRLFMEGKTPSSIAKHLTGRGILSPGGKETWQVSTVESILTNEKYRGDAVLQKSYTVDFLTKKTKVNMGEVPQYYVENSHPAIIDPSEYEAVQAEMERRKKLGRPSACNSPLSTRIVCADCGGYYGAKVWGSNTKYRKVIWRCNNKYIRDEKCVTRHVTEEEVMRKFVTAFNSVLAYRAELISNCRLAQEALCDFSALDKEASALRQEVEVLAGLVKKSLQTVTTPGTAEGSVPNARADYLERHEKGLRRLRKIEDTKRDKQCRKSLMDNFIQNIENSGECLGAFDERLWAAVTDRVTVMPDGALLYRFRDGTEITIGED